MQHQGHLETIYSGFIRARPPISCFNPGVSNCLKKPTKSSREKRVEKMRRWITDDVDDSRGTSNQGAETQIPTSDSSLEIVSDGCDTSFSAPASSDGQIGFICSIGLLNDVLQRMSTAPKCRGIYQFLRMVTQY